MNPVQPDQGPVQDATSTPPPSPPKEATPKRSYPGSFDHMFLDAKGVLMFDALDGFRAEIMKQVTPFFTITHGLMLGSVYFPREIGNSLYTLSIDCYYNKKNFNATLDSTKRVGGRIVWPVNKSVSAVFNVLTSTVPGQDSASAEISYKGPDYHVSGKVSLGSVLSLTYSQFVSDRLTMGLEAGYNPLHQGLSYSVGAKYGDGAGFLGATVSSTKQMEAWYMKRASKKTQLVSKLAVDFSNRMSELQVGCLYTFKSGKMYMTLTSSGHLQSFIEEFVTPTLLMTLSVDHSIPSNTSRVGFSTKVVVG